MGESELVIQSTIVNDSKRKTRCGEKDCFSHLEENLTTNGGIAQIKTTQMDKSAFNQFLQFDRDIGQATFIN